MGRWGRSVVAALPDGGARLNVRRDALAAALAQAEAVAVHADASAAGAHDVVEALGQLRLTKDPAEAILLLPSAAVRRAVEVSAPPQPRALHGGHLFKYGHCTAGPVGPRGDGHRPARPSPRHAR
jgi:hypothetical protein